MPGCAFSFILLIFFFSIFSAFFIYFFVSPGALLLVWAETLQTGNTPYSLQLHSVFGSVSWAGLQFRQQQSELLSVCGAVHQNPAGWRQEQEEKGEAARSLYNIHSQILSGNFSYREKLMNEAFVSRFPCFILIFDHILVKKSLCFLTWSCLICCWLKKTPVHSPIKCCLDNLNKF